MSEVFRPQRNEDARSVADDTAIVNIMSKYLLVMLGSITCAVTAGCGDQARMEQFHGEYVLDTESMQRTGEMDGAMGAAIAQLKYKMFSPLTVNDRVIRYGDVVVGEFRLEEFDVEDNVLRGIAIWHGDVNRQDNQGRRMIVLRLDGDRLHFTFDEENTPESELGFLVYQRVTR